jgi:hypothetical protein
MENNDAKNPEPAGKEASPILVTADYVFMVLMALIFAGLLTLVIFGELTGARCLVLLLTSLNLLSLWCVLLCFRVLVQQNDLRNYILYIPMEAARIAVSYLQGRRPDK